MDNAPYHTSSSTMKILEELEIPMIFTGPHSYDASPCELAFGHFKKADINPRKLPMNKR